MDRLVAILWLPIALYFLLISIPSLMWQTLARRRRRRLHKASRRRSASSATAGRADDPNVIDIARGGRDHHLRRPGTETTARETGVNRKNSFRIRIPPNLPG